MEEGYRSIVNQNQQIMTCQDIICQIKEDMVLQQTLLKKKEELVEQAQEEVDQKETENTELKVKNIELESSVSDLNKKVSRMNDTHKDLQAEVLQEKSKFDKVLKRNLLIDELNKDMMDMNIEDIWKFINQSLYEWVHTIRRQNVKQILNVGDKVVDTLREQGLKEVPDSIEEIMRNFEFLHQKQEAPAPKPGTYFI